MAKNLITFFSATGSTRKVANTLAKITGGDIYEIFPAEIYTDKDLNWNNRGSRSSKEMENLHSRPELADNQEPTVSDKLSIS